MKDKLAPATAKVRYSCGTNLARCEGHLASSTSSQEQAVCAAGLKFFRHVADFYGLPPVAACKATKLGEGVYRVEVA